MSAEWKEIAIVSLLLACAVGLKALGDVPGSSMLVGAACALVVPKAGTPTRLMVVGAVIGTSMLAQGCGTVTKPVVRSAVRVACDVADVVLSGEPECSEERSSGGSSEKEERSR